MLAVLLGHFFPFLNFAGGFGVELFFVLSGRLMANILFVQKLDLPTFFVRRFSRVYPALFMLVCTLSVLSLFTGLGANPSEAAASLTFTINYLAAFHWIETANLAHIWSVAIEEHCYALLALLALLLVRNERLAIIICSVVALLAMANGIRLFAAGAGGTHEIYWRTDVRLAPIFLSAALFLFLRHRRVHPLVPMACALISAPIYYLGEPLPVRYTIVTVLLAVAVNSLDHAYDFFRAELSRRWLTWLGQFSYSLYLWQQPFHVESGHFTALPFVFAAALLSYYLVEEPARQMINDRWKRRRLAKTSTCPALET